MEGVEDWSRTVTTEKCLAEFNRNGVPSSAYRTVAEALSDPQIAHRGALAEVEDGGGTFKVMNLPFRMSGAKVTRGQARGDPGRTYRCASQGERPFRRARLRLSPASRLMSRATAPCIS